jgi:hypothetical protein
MSSRLGADRSAGFRAGAAAVALGTAAFFAGGFAFATALFAVRLGARFGAFVFTFAFARTRPRAGDFFAGALARATFRFAAFFGALAFRTARVLGFRLMSNLRVRFFAWCAWPRCSAATVAMRGV